MRFGNTRQRNTGPISNGPVAGGLVGGVLQAMLMRRVGRFAGGGLKGAIVGAAATYAINRFLTTRRR